MLQVLRKIMKRRYLKAVRDMEKDREREREKDRKKEKWIEKTERAKKRARLLFGFLMHL